MKKKLLATLLFSLLLSACAPDQVKTDDELLSDSQNIANNTNNDSTQIGGMVGDNGLDGSNLQGGVAGTMSYARNAINDPASPLAERIIYFGFDDDMVSADYLDLLVHHGKYLATNPAMKLRIEGHGDERGSPEYNIALGNRRAEAVRRLVLFQGADSAQISVVSYGEEKPVALNHDEEAWRLNRRVELVYEAR